jgi:hypothetical protein
LTLGEEWIRRDGLFELRDLCHVIATYDLVLGLNDEASFSRDAIIAELQRYEHVERLVSVKLRPVDLLSGQVMKGQMGGTLPLVKDR